MRLRLRRRRRSAGSLTVCPRCDADCVVPVEWAEREPEAWWMRLRCGACGHLREIVVPDATAQRYDLELDRGMGQIADALSRLERDRMALEADNLAVALRLDLVDADDFDGRR